MLTFSMSRKTMGRRMTRTLVRTKTVARVVVSTSTQIIDFSSSDRQALVGAKLGVV